VNKYIAVFFHIITSLVLSKKILNQYKSLSTWNPSIEYERINNESSAFMDCTHFSIALQQTSFFFFFSFFYRIISSLSRHSIPHKLQQIIKLATFAWNCKTFSRPQPSSRNTFSRAFESSLPGTKTRTQHILPVVSCLHNHLQNINAPACTTTNLGHPARD
jgi:hypothetical protein